MPEHLTLYAAKCNPYAESIELALLEAKIDYKRYDVPLGNLKPKWFTEQVNPSGLVPAISYGGPVVPPDQPSPESFKLGESTVVLQFIADVAPESGLLPSDIKLRARARYFMHQVIEKAVPGFDGVFIKRESPDVLLKAFEELQALLNPDEGTFVIGSQFTIADAAFIPILTYSELGFKHDLGSFPAGDGVKAYKVLAEDPKFKRLRAYLARVTAMPNFQKLHDEAGLMEFAQMFNKLRA